VTSLIFHIIAGILGLWLAIKFVPNVYFNGDIKILLLAGLFLGLINFFIKPILRIFTLPLRILTLGIFGLIINMGIIWAVDIFFPELDIKGIVALFWTTLIIWLLHYFLGFYSQKKKNIAEG
jgi:putative membrane protein